MTFADALNVVLTAATVPVATILTGFLFKLYQHFDKTATAQDKANLETEIQAALGAGLAAVQADMPIAMANGVMSPRLREAILVQAGNYFRTRFPDRAKQIAAVVQGTGQQPVAAIRQTLDSRLSNINLTTPLVAVRGQVVSAAKVAPATTLAAPALHDALPP